MVMYTSEIFKIIKNTVMEQCIGLIFPQNRLINIMMENGGQDCPVDLDTIKEETVFEFKI